jgi:hypothetical protein
VPLQKLNGRSRRTTVINYHDFVEKEKRSVENISSFKEPLWGDAKTHMHNTGTTCTPHAPQARPI